jgi:hypothetical protein
MVSKIFDGYLILNWKTGSMKVLKRKSKRRTANPFEIVVHFQIEVQLPEAKEHEVKGKIVVPEEQVAEMVFEELRS